jgi:hypothetical protein
MTQSTDASFRQAKYFRIFVSVKKVFAITLLTVYLISLTELKQLVKFPALVSHFIKHKQQDNRLSLLAFLDMHYAHGDLKDADYDEDMQLPFKSHDNCVNASFISFVPNSFEELNTKPTLTQNQVYTVYSERFLKSSYLSFIWQPPKFS